MVIVGVVLAAALLHATWSSLAKTATDQIAGFVAISVTATGIGVAILGLVPSPDRSAWPFLAASGSVHVVYMLLLAWSYHIGDFSQVYPLARGTSPLLVTVVGLVALAEAPPPARIVGVALVCAGLAMLALAGGRSAVSNPTAVLAALATGLTITCYTVLDGVGVRRSDAVVGYAVWLQLLMGVGFLLVVLAARGRRVAAMDRRTLVRGLLGGLIAAVAYTLVLYAQTRTSLGAVSALRETSIVFGALIGAVFLHEPLGRRRILAAVVVATGVVLLA